MSSSIRCSEKRRLIVDSVPFLVEVLERPFREGVELCTDFQGEKIRVSDLGLGEHEAMRILEQEILSRMEASR